MAEARNHAGSCWARGSWAVARMFETTMTVPTRQLRELTSRLTKAGFTVLDTGQRIMTDEGPEGEATVRLVHLPTMQVDFAHADLGVSV